MDGFKKDARFLDAIADADSFPYWFDDVDEPESNPMLVHDERCDLCVVGGGYTGLWTAVVAKERDPSRDVVLIEAHEIASAASGRNGGFMDSSLTHGIANAQERDADVARLQIVSTSVDEGPTIKRFQPKDRGRSHPIMKRTSHISVTVGERD